MSRAFVLAVLCGALAARSAAAEQWSRSYSTGASPTLQVEVDDASVRVSAWTEPRIQIDVDAEGWKLGPGGLRLVDSQAGGTVDFALHEPALEFHFFDVGRRRVRVEIHAPATTALDVHSGDGNVECEGMAATARIRTGDGNIAVDGLAGDVTLHTGDGRIEAWDLDGPLTASSGDGSVRVRGRFDALDVGSSDGSVTVDVAPGSRVGAGWRIRTGDGPIVVRLPGDLATTLDAHTGDGGITVDLPVEMRGPMRDNDLHAQLHGGGPELRLRTGDGSILIEPFVADAARPSADAVDDERHGARHRVHSLRHGR